MLKDEEKKKYVRQGPRKCVRLHIVATIAVTHTVTQPFLTSNITPVSRSPLRNLADIA